MKLGNLKIAVRLGMTFCIVVAILAIIISIALNVLSRLNDDTARIITERWPAIEVAQGNYTEANNISLAIRNMMLHYDVADQQKELANIVRSRTAIKNNDARLQKMIVDEAGLALLKKTLSLQTRFMQQQDKVLEYIDLTMLDEAKKYLTVEVLPDFIAYRDSLAQLVAYQAGLMQAASQDTQSSYVFTRNLIVTIGVLGLLLVGVIGAMMTRSITVPMQHAVAIAEVVARGDFTSDIRSGNNDETGKLLTSLQHMNTSLHRTVDEVRQGADSITTASLEVADGMDDLSSRTEQQAIALQHSASSIEQLTAMVRHNADSAQQVNTLAISASDIAAEGGTVVAEVVKTMEAINASAKKIVDIISVIDGIAFQTNILALNAAVEAARAGEQGRGFAVVASEVRTLAQRSANAAREIKGLIDTSVDNVGYGSKLVNQAGTTMSGIVVSVKKVADIIGEISTASHEQSLGIEQINRAIAEMDGTTQQNAALVRQVSVASQALQHQAASLGQAVSVFKLRHAGLHPPEAAAVLPMSATEQQRLTLAMTVD